ncbi:MAG TPA: amidohydrolase family protein [Bacillota bacterium]
MSAPVEPPAGAGRPRAVEKGLIAQMLILRNGTVITMKDPVKADPRTADLVVEDGLIAALGAEAAGAGTCASAEVIDLTGKYVLPGLIDAHCHLTYSGALISEEVARTDKERTIHAVNNAFVTLLSGVTTCRDPGGVDHIDVAVRDAVRAGLIHGPRVVAGGQMIGMTGGHGWFFGCEADGRDGVRRAARLQIKAHTDWVKFMASGGFAEVGEQPGAAQLNEDEMAAGIEEAHKAGKRTAAHAHSAVAIKNAVRAGIDSVEHASFPDDEAIEMLLKRDVYIDPTFSIYWKMIQHGAEYKIAPELIEMVRRAWDVKVERFLAAHRAGVKVAAGTDSGSPAGRHGDFQAELERFVDVGLSPYGALRIGTVGSAGLLGLDGMIGTIERGKRADLIVLSACPLEDITAARRVELVIKDGRVHRVGKDSITLPALSG